MAPKGIGAEMGKAVKTKTARFCRRGAACRTGGGRLKGVSQAQAFQNRETETRQRAVNMQRRIGAYILGAEFPYILHGPYAESVQNYLHKAFHDLPPGSLLP
jgi:hypothetical protein